MWFNILLLSKHPHECQETWLPEMVVISAAVGRYTPACGHMANKNCWRLHKSNGIWIIWIWICLGPRIVCIEIDTKSIRGRRCCWHPAQEPLYILYQILGWSLSRGTGVHGAAQNVWGPLRHTTLCAYVACTYLSSTLMLWKKDHQSLSNSWLLFLNEHGSFRKFSL